MKETRKFSYKSSVTETRQRYKLLSDPIPIFFEERCEDDVTAIITKEELHQAYIEWCKEKNLIPVNKIAFGRVVMREKYAKPNRSSWLGISLKKHDGDAVTADAHIA